MDKHYLFVDKRMPNTILSYFKEQGYHIITIPTNHAVYEEISSHVDIFVTKIQNTLILEKSTYDYFKENRHHHNWFDQMEVIQGNTTVKKDYPHDIAYNVCLVGKLALHCCRYTDHTVVEHLQQNGYERVNVKQGYSRCSTVVLNEKALITSDSTIEKAAKEHGIQVLFLPASSLAISLFRQNNYSPMMGFLGGASCVLSNKVIVFGELKESKYKVMLLGFLKEQGMLYHEFKGLPLVDYGGVVEIVC